MNLNPIERWSPQQARLHPFITGEKFTKPFVVCKRLIISMDDLFMYYTSLRATLHNSNKSPLLLFLPQARQIPNGRLEGSFRPSPRAHEPIKMPLLTTSTLPSIKLSRPRPRRRLRQRTLLSATRTSRRSYSRSHLPLRTLLPPATRGTHIRNNQHPNTRNTRRMHKVSGSFER